jgi:hypothetical protein
MKREWIEAVGANQLSFLGAASKALKGNAPPCPHCRSSLRAYFHLFDVANQKGTIWVWCGACFHHSHLPRVTPQIAFPDPFGQMSRAEVADLETSSSPSFMDRLEDLWRKGLIGRHGQ